MHINFKKYLGKKNHHHSWIYVFIFLGKLTLLYPPDSIWWILWFHFFTPSQPPQCVQRFHCYHYNEKNIIASLLKFAGYIHNYKILPGNIFGLILKNRMAFCWPSRAKDIIARDLKYAGYVPHYKILTGNIFILIFKMIIIIGRIGLGW